MFLYKKYRFSLCLTYVVSVLTYYFFEGCQQQFFLRQLSSAELAALALAGCRCVQMYC